MPLRRARLALLLSAGLWSAPVAACDYGFVVQGDPYEAALRGADAVFAGRVDRVELVAPDSLAADGMRSDFELGMHYRATFTVAHAWKGPQSEVEVSWFSNCDRAFDVGHRYLVVADSTAGSLVAFLGWEEQTPVRFSAAAFEGLDAAAVRLRSNEGLDVRPWKR